MKTRSIIVRITFWWSLTTAVSGGVVGPLSTAAQDRRQIGADSSSVSLPAIPMAGEDSVHMLTSVRFPPPALFFVDPDKKWALSDFERPDRPTSYAVSDYDVAEQDDDAGEQDKQQAKDPETAVTTVEPDEETTTVIDETLASVPLAVIGHREATTVDRPPDDVPTLVMPVDRQPPTTTDGRSDSGQTVAADRWKYQRPAGNARPAQTILLTSRPLPPPVTNIRFPNVEFAVIRRQQTPTVNLGLLP